MEIKCAACESNEVHVIYKNPVDYEYGVKHSYDLCKCSNCNVIFINPIPDPEEVPNLYPENYYSFYKDQSRIKVLPVLEKIYTKRHLNYISGLCGSKGRILDIGCGDGRFLFMLKKFNNNLDLYGVDIKISDRLKTNKDIKFISSDFLDFKFKDNYFDVIRMNQFIEHIAKPNDVVRKAYNLLKEGSFLIGETPNTNSFSYRFWKSLWGPLHVPRHFVIFNNENIEQLFKKEGFKDVQIFNTLMPTGWAKSIKNIFIKLNIIGPKDNTTKLYPLFLILSLPLIILDYYLGHSSIMEFVARK